DRRRPRTLGSALARRPHPHENPWQAAQRRRPRRARHRHYGQHPGRTPPHPGPPRSPPAPHRALRSAQQPPRVRDRDRCFRFHRGSAAAEAWNSRRKEDHQDLTSPPDEVEFLLIAAEREGSNELYRQGTLKDEAQRRLERELDLREASIASHQPEQ